MKTRQTRGLKRLWCQCLSLSLLAFTVCGGIAWAQDETPDSPSPILISEYNSTRALAADPDKYRGGLPKFSVKAFQPGADSRSIVFISNITLPNDEGADALRIYAQDVRGKNFRLSVESIEPVAKMNSVYAVTVRLYDQNGYNGQPLADGDVLLRLTWHGMASNRVRFGMGFAGGKIEDDENAVPTPPATSRSKAAEINLASNTGDRARFMEQAAFGASPVLDLRLRQIGIQRWIEEQFNKTNTFPYPDLPQGSTDDSVGCPGVDTDPADQMCRRDRYTQYRNQNWMFQEALYGDDQLRRRVSWALGEIWVVSGVDTQQQRWQQEYIEVLDRNAFGNYRNLMAEMTLNPAMGNYLDMVRSTRTNPNENYPREILQLFSIGLDMLNQNGTPILDAQGNRVPTYDQDKIVQFTKVFTGWSQCNNGANPLCPNAVAGAPNYIDPMYLAAPNNHDQTAKSLFNYQGAPNPTIAACTNCTTDANRIVYANDSLNKTLDNIFYHPNVAPFVGKLMIQNLVTGDPTPAYIGRVAAAFNNNGSGVRGDMKAVIRAVLLDPEARGSVKTAPDYGKLREPFQFASNLMRQFNVRASGAVTVNGTPTNPPTECSNRSDGYINPQTSAMGQNVWNSPTVFNYYPPDYVIPGTDLNGPEFGILNSGTAFSRINFINTMVYGQINFNPAATNPVPTAPCGTSIDLSEALTWAGADASGDTLIENLNRKMLRNTMSQAMKDKLRTAIQAVPAGTSQVRDKARQAVYLVATSSQYQVQR